MLEVTKTVRMTMLRMLELQSCVVMSSDDHSSTLCNVNLLSGTHTQHAFWLDFAMTCLQLGAQSKEQLETKEAELQV